MHGAFLLFLLSLLSTISLKSNHDYTALEKSLHNNAAFFDYWNFFYFMLKGNSLYLLHAHKHSVDRSDIRLIERENIKNTASNANRFMSHVQTYTYTEPKCAI